MPTGREREHIAALQYAEIARVRTRERYIFSVANELGNSNVIMAIAEDVEASDAGLQKSKGVQQHVNSALQPQPPPESEPKAMPHS